MRKLEESDEFLAAGKRNLARVLPVEYPGQQKIEDQLK
jgi:hypothetical protein